MCIHTSGPHGKWTLLPGAEWPGGTRRTYTVDPEAVGWREGLLRLRVTVPLAGICGYWHPAATRPALKLDWDIRFASAAQCAFPFLCFFSDDHRNRCALGLSDLARDTAVTCRMNQERGCYEVEFALTPAGPFTLRLDTRPAIDWGDALADYRAWVAPGPAPVYPADAWNPVFCTWYAVHAALREAWVEENARQAANLGFGTLILDDGWCFDEDRRVTPETLGDWYKDIGAWTVSTAKFPDFTGHVARVQAMGLRYLVWVAPFMVGTNSPVASATALRGDVVEGRREIDFARPGQADAVLERMEALVRDYGLDGLKVDFLDMVAPSPEAPGGHPILAWLTRLRAAISGAKEDALLEYRQHYTSPALLTCATQFRAGDVPFDFLENFNRIAQIRRIVGDGVPVHADPIYWPPGEDGETVARHWAASLAGVPMASMDLARLTPVERAIATHFLRFYNDHRDLYRNAHWHVTYRGDMAASVMGTWRDETLAICADEESARAVATRCAEGRLHLLNLSPAPLSAQGAAEVFDGAGIPVATGTIPKGGRAVYQK